MKRRVSRGRKQKRLATGGFEVRQRERMTKDNVCSHSLSKAGCRRKSLSVYVLRIKLI